MDYFPVGIVLNLRPRISRDGKEITMQTETIVSAVSSTGTVGTVGQVVVAPVVDSRQVQTFVRIADNTPFIIGGLISTDERERMTGIPLLSEIPWIGALFRRTSTSRTRQEVIVVITPHVVPLEDKYFSYVLPKDSSLFDRFGHRLFRNAYRIRGDDIFDLDFVYDSNVYQDLLTRLSKVTKAEPQLQTTEPFASLLKRGIPSEEILVRRMLWEIIDKVGYARHIDPERIIFFESRPDAPGGSGFQVAFLSQVLKNLGEEHNATALTFEGEPRGTMDRPLVPPKAVVSYENVTAETYPVRLIEGNRSKSDGGPGNWMILLSQEYAGIRVPPLELLRSVLALKRILELNSSLPLTIEDFHIGRQIIFPSEEELGQGYQLVDREVARLFYEVYNYYPAFEDKFRHEIQRVAAALDQLER